MHVHSALGVIQDLRKRIIESQSFYGYSGGARICGGLFALIGAFVLSWSALPETVVVHVIGWGLVFIAAVALNYFQLITRVKKVIEDATLLTSPVLDPLLPLLVGGAITLALIARGDCDILFGVWMSLFGLSNLAAKNNLPKASTLIGYFYVAAGLLYLVLFPIQDFSNPWPMGLVFFVGEVAGGIVFCKHNTGAVCETNDEEEIDE